jgi:hypothetical protein
MILTTEASGSVNKKRALTQDVVGDGCFQGLCTHHRRQIGGVVGHCACMPRMCLIQSTKPTSQAVLEVCSVRCV